MSQISVHNESSMFTVYSSQTSGGLEAIKHLAAVLKLLRTQDQLKMMVRLEPFVAWEANHTRYLAVISTRFASDYFPGSQPDLSRTHSLPDTSGLKESSEEVCILGIDVTGPLQISKAPVSSIVPQTSSVVSNNSTPTPIVSQKAQRSHSTVSPDHQTIGSRIASRTRKFLTLPKQRNQTKPVSPSPRLAKRPSISSSVMVKLEDLPQECDDNSVHIGLVLPIWADSKISLDGDGGFRIESKDRHHTFKPVSVQAMWSVLQTLLKASENAKRHHQLSPAAIGPRHSSLSSNLMTMSSLTTTITTTTTTRESSVTLDSSNTTSMTTVSLSDHPALSGSHSWVDHYSKRIDSEWIKEWHLNLDDFLSYADLTDTGSTSQPRRPLSPHLSKHRQQAYTATEMKIRKHLREVMLNVDLEQVNSKEIRQRVEKNLSLDLSAFKSFIDHEILVILGQMDAASEIFDYLYLGTEWNASNLDELKDKDISLVLNVTTEINNSFPGKFDYRNIRVNDTEEEAMVKHWEDAFRYISEAKKDNKRVLVHCKMGVSRSASVVIAYAMKAYDWNLQHAMEFVKKRRSCIQPNPGFVKQLEEYEGMLEASKHRTSFQSLSGSTLSLCETRSKNSSLDIDDLYYSNLCRSQAEFCSTPNLAPSVPQRAESLRLSSRPAKFYLENSDDENASDKLRQTKLVKKNSRRSKTVKWEPIEENTVKEDQKMEDPDDVFGMLRVVVDTQPVQSASFDQPSTTRIDPTRNSNRSVSLTEDLQTITGEFCLRQTSTQKSTAKVRQSRFSASSVFGLSNIPVNAPPPVKENKYSLGNKRPASIHVSSYLKPKDPVQTLVKYFDEMTRSPHNPPMQAAQV